MKVGLIDVDNIGKTVKFPSLPLMKISAYHKRRRDAVEWWLPFEHYDVVYQSKVFTDSEDVQYNVFADEIMRGGTGYDLKNKLPRAIEHIMPDYGMYNGAFGGTAYGFITRGCPRGCGFCIVGKKEGRATKRVAELSEFWNGQRNIKLLDANLLACGEREAILNELAQSRAWVDFTQGLDIRMMDADIAQMIKRIKIKRVHFAWDNPKDDLRERFAEFTRVSGLARPYVGVYVLVNYHSTLRDDLERIYAIRELNLDPYVMIYDKAHASREIRRLQRWCNNRYIFTSCERFEDYS